MLHFTFLLALSLFISCSQSNFDKTLSQFDSELDFNGIYTLESFNTNPIIVLGKDVEGNKIKIKLIGKSKGKEDDYKKAQEVLNLFRSQYSSNVLPYPGQVTLISSCESILLPQLVTDNNMIIYKFFSNDRLGLCICSDEKVKYFQYTFFLKTQKGLLFAVDLFLLKNNNKNELKSYLKNLNLDKMLISPKLEL